MFFRNIISPSGTWSWKSTNIQFWSKLRTLGAPYWWCGVWCVHVEMTKLCPCFGSNMWPLSNPNSDHTELLHVVLLHSSFSRMLSIFVRLFQKRCIEFRTVFCDCAFFGFTLQVTSSGETLGLHQEAWFTARSGFLRYLGFVLGHLGIAVHVSTHHHPWDIHQFLAVNPTMILRIGLGHPRCSNNGYGYRSTGIRWYGTSELSLRCLIWTWEGLLKWPGRSTACHS